MGDTYEGGPDAPASKRTDNDIDSIELGTPSKGGFKLYYNSRLTSQEELQKRIDLALNVIAYAKQKMGV